ncbi:MAG: tyrosine-type recombinase/integrase [Candidatus Helarchaeota archaeon]
MLQRLLLGVEDLNPESIARWIDEYRFGPENSSLSPYGKNNYYSTIKWYLARSSLINYPKDLLLRIKKIPIKPKDRKVDDLALEHLLQFSPNTTFELAFRLMRERGLRPHELLSIRARDVSRSEEGYAVISLPDMNPAVPSKRNKTGGRTIVVVKNADRLLSLTEEVRRRDGHNGRLFPWKNGVLSAIFYKMKRMQKKFTEIEGWNKIYKGRLYDLRHAVITDMYVQGFGDQEVRAMVGWTPASKMPDIYVHVSKKHLLDVCKRVEAKYVELRISKENYSNKIIEHNHRFVSRSIIKPTKEKIGLNKKGRFYYFNTFLFAFFDNGFCLLTYIIHGNINFFSFGILYKDSGRVSN